MASVYIYESFGLESKDISLVLEKKHKTPYKLSLHL